jgi:hypothetical protein
VIEGRVRHALTLLADTQEDWGFPRVSSDLLDEMAVFCHSFPEGTAAEYWRWHLDRIAVQLDRDREHASP